VRLRLCRRLAALPLRRVVDLLRLCRFLLAAMTVTLVTEWIGVVVVGSDQSSSHAFVAFVGVLGLASAAVPWAACWASSGLTGHAQPIRTGSAGLVGRCRSAGRA